MLDLVLFILPNPALQDPKMYQPLGVLYLASVVKKARYSVELIDMRDGDKSIPDARFYGFSCTTPEINQARRIARQVKGKTIIGGSHPTLMPHDCHKFDYLVRGEGEEVINGILGNTISPGIIIAPRVRDLDKVPYPAWDRLGRNPFSESLFPGQNYGLGDKAATLIASRGCPYKCAFCGNMLNKPVTFRSVPNIVGELKMLKEMGIKHFRFEDDNFTIHPQFKQLCNEIKELDIRYKCHTRSNFTKLDKMQLMYESGCEECGLGVESADDVVLETNNKRVAAVQHKRAVRVIKEAGLRAKTYWMSGLPGETDATIRYNMNFMTETKPDKWTLSTFTPYPGCDIFNNPNKYNIEIVNWDFSNWWNFVFNEKHKQLEGRRGYVHVLKGQTQAQMEERHNKFRDFLESGVWK